MAPSGCWGSLSCPPPWGCLRVSAPTWLCWGTTDLPAAPHLGAGMCPSPAQLCQDCVPPQRPLPTALTPAGSSARKRHHETTPEVSSEARMLCSWADTAVLWPQVFLGHFTRPVSQMLEKLSARTGSLAPPADGTGATWIHSRAVVPVDGCSWSPHPDSQGTRRVPSPGADSETCRCDSVRWVTHCYV